MNKINLFKPNYAAMSDHFGNIPIQPPESSPLDKKPNNKTTPPPAGSSGSSRPSKPSRTEARRRSTKPAPFGRTWALIIFLTIIIAGYSALGFFGVPYYFSRIVPKNFHEKTAMVLEPAAVAFNPFTFRFKAEDIRILAESGASILSLRTLEAEIAPLAILHREMTCKTLTINGLDLNLVRELDGSYNFQPIFGAGKNKKISDIIKQAELPFAFSLNNISVADSKITFNDKPSGKIHTADKIKLDLPTFSNTSSQADQCLRPHFSAIVNGSPIELTGQTNLGRTAEELATRLTMDVHDLELPTYAGYLPFSLPMICTKGTANGTIDLLFDPHNKNGDNLSIGFQLQIAGAELIETNESINISVPSARVDGSLQPVSRTLQLHEVVLKEPTVSSFGESLLKNIEQLGKDDAPTTPVGETTEKTAPLRLTLDQLLVDNGVVRFFSQIKDQQPAATWKTMQVSIKNYHTDAEVNPNDNNGSLKISGEKEGSSASFSWQGKFSAPDILTGNLHFVKMEGKDLLKLVGDNRPFTIKDIQGLADLKGQLIFYTKKESPNRIYYKLIDAEVSVDDFALLDNEQNILNSPVVKLTGFSLIDETIDFGNILLQNGTARFIYGRLPKIYREFTSGKYHLHGLDFEGKALIAAEKKSDQSLTFTDVSLKANELGSGQKLSDNLSVSGKTEAGGIVQAQGSVALSPFSVTLKTGFRQLPVQNIRSLFTTSALPGDLHGNLSGKGLLSLPAKSFVGDLELSDVSGKTPKNTPFSWQKSVFRDVNYTAHPYHFGVASVAVDAARFSWQITRETNSPMQFFSNIMKNYFSAPDEQSSTKTESTASPVDIDEISFTAGTLDIHDRRLDPDWTAAGVSFAGSIKNIHAAASAESRFTFTGKLAESPFTIDGSTALFTNEENGKFHFSLDNFPLSSFAKQLEAKTEIETGEGQLKLALDCTWQDHQYISSGKVVLADLKPVAASSDIALPLALLTDSNGTIQLPFNFSRTAPVAQTSLVEELFTTLQRMLLKGSVSPLLLASGDFTDLIGNDFIEFHPGEFILTESDKKTLGRYAELLIAHPTVGLVLSGGVDKKIDGQAMKKDLAAIEQLRVEKENEKLYKQWQDQKTRYQKGLEEQQPGTDPEDKIFEQDIPPEILTDFKPLRPVPVVVDEAMLLELARKRIDIAYQFLTTQQAVPPERISRVLPNSLADEPESPANGVATTLKTFSQ